MLINADEVAKRLSLTREAVYQIPPDRLPCYHVGPKGGRRRYEESDVEAYLKLCRDGGHARPRIAFRYLR